MPAPTAVNYIRHRAPSSALGRLDDAWPFETHIAVRTLEELDRLTRVTMAVAGVKRSKLPKPLILPRPGEKRDAPPPTPTVGWVAALVEMSDTPAVDIVQVS